MEANERLELVKREVEDILKDMKDAEVDRTVEESFGNINICGTIYTNEIRNLIKMCDKHNVMMFFDGKRGRAHIHSI